MQPLSQLFYDRRAGFWQPGTLDGGVDPSIPYLALEGTTGVTGTGALAAQASLLDGTGLSLSSGVGILLAQGSVIDGIGFLPVFGTGALAAQSAQILGAGVVRWVGTGALVAQASQMDGVGLSLSQSTFGELVSAPANIAGAGTVGAVAGGGNYWWYYDHRL